MRVIATAVLLALSIDPLVAQVSCPSLAPAETNSVSSNVNCLTAGHVDHDGRSDVAVGTDANEVVLHKRTAELTFVPHVFPLEGRPMAIAMGDFDANSSADIAVVHSSSLVSIILLDRDFNQIGGSTLRADDNPVAIAAADLTSDGYLDLIVANMFSNNVSVFIGNGDGSFALMGNYPAGNAPAGVAAADFDGDGHVDVVAANFGTSTVSLLLGDGSGTLDTHEPQVIAADVDPSAVAAGDFNNDGVPDLATANFGSSNVSVILGARSAGTYVPSTPVHYFAERAPVAITAAHFDAGANLDLIVSNGGAGTVSLLAGAGDGTFEEGNSRTVEGLPWNTTSGQFDNSLVRGIAAAHFSAPSFSVFTSGCPGEPFLRDFTPKAGPVAGNQLVRLTGHTLGDTIKVEFDTEEATIVSRSGSAVDVLTPPSLQGQVIVKITTSSGDASKSPYTFIATPHVTGSPFIGSRGGFQYALLDGGTYSEFRPTFTEILREVRIGSVPVKIVYDQVPFPLPPQWRGDGMQAFIETPPSPDGAVGLFDVTVTTLAGAAVMSQQYQYFNNIPDPVPGAINVIDEDTPTTIRFEGDDPDIGDVLELAITTLPTKGTLSPAFKPDPFDNAWELVYTPHPDATGSDSFAYTLTDGLDTSAAESVEISITPVNDSPEAISQLFNTDEETPLNVTLTGSDVETAGLTQFNVVTPPSFGTLSGSEPNLIYTPDTNAFGSDSFTFTVSDGSLTSTPATISIEIANVNDAPAAAAQSLNLDEDTPLEITLSGNDVDEDGLGFEIVTLPEKGTLTGSGATWLYTPNPNVNGSDSFSFEVNDGTSSSEPEAISLLITPVNDAPVSIAQSVDVRIATPTSIVLEGTDAEDAPLTFAVVAPPEHGTLDGAAPNLTYTPYESYLGSDHFTFTVNDGDLTSAATTVSITVSGARLYAASLFVPESAGFADIELTLTSVLDVSASLDWNTADETAGAPGDYQTSGGSVIFGPGTTSRTIRVPIIDDDSYEGFETFTIGFSDLSNISGDAIPVTVGIKDDDQQPMVVISDVLLREGNSGTTNFNFTLSLIGDAEVPVTVRCATADGTAIAGSDYTARTDSITFNPGEKTKVFTVGVRGDTSVEILESFRVILTPLLNAVTGAPGTGWIVPDDVGRRRASR
jgi:hypothetical protein